MGMMLQEDVVLARKEIQELSWKPVELQRAGVLILSSTSTGLDISLWPSKHRPPINLVELNAIHHMPH